MEEKRLKRGNGYSSMSPERRQEILMRQQATARATRESPAAAEEKAASREHAMSLAAALGWVKLKRQPQE